MRIRTLSTRFLIIVAVVLVFGAFNNARSEGATTLARVQTTFGEITILLWPDEAPRVVAFFRKLVEARAYDGIDADEVRPEIWMMIGGKLSGKGSFSGSSQNGDSAENVTKPRQHEQGMVTMLHSPGTRLDGRFAICLGDVAAYLDGKATPFGKVVGSKVVLEKIARSQKRVLPFSTETAPRVGIQYIRLFEGDLAFAERLYQEGVGYCPGRGALVNYQDAVRCFRAAAEQGLPKAEMEMGVACTRGLGVTRSETEGFGWFLRSAEHGFPEAQYIVGIAFGAGSGTARDDGKSAFWLGKAATNDQAQAQVHLGYRYFLGQDVEPSPSEAARWFKRAAEHHWSVGEYLFGLCLKDGCGVETNVSEAFRLCEMAATHGYAPAQADLGVFYYNGLGVASNRQQSVAWTRLAAERKVTSAMRLYGMLLESANRKSDAMAWYSRAAQQGDGDAQLRLVGLAIASNTPEDLIEACKWAEIRAAAGLPGAMDLRNLIVKGMTPQQVQDARARAAAFAPKPEPSDIYQATPITPVLFTTKGERVPDQMTQSQAHPGTQSVFGGAAMGMSLFMDAYQMRDGGGYSPSRSAQSRAASAVRAGQAKYREQANRVLPGTVWVDRDLLPGGR